MSRIEFHVIVNTYKLDQTLHIWTLKNNTSDSMDVV
jgi:hypothetical protein